MRGTDDFLRTRFFSHKHESLETKSQGFRALFRAVQSFRRRAHGQGSSKQVAKIVQTRDLADKLLASRAGREHNSTLSVASSTAQGFHWKTA